LRSASIKTTSGPSRMCETLAAPPQNHIYGNFAGSLDTYHNAIWKHDVCTKIRR
jgi:hypothetical protein